MVTGRSFNSFGSSFHPPACQSGSCEPEHCNLSGEILSGLSPVLHPNHCRSGSGQIMYSSTMSSSTTDVLSVETVCPSGKIKKKWMFTWTIAGSDMLNHRIENYNHGSVMQGGSDVVTPPLPDPGMKCTMRNLNP